MQDRYFGDVGDFGKFGLLRALCTAGAFPKLALGVVWYLFPNESHNADGKHLGYLQKPHDYCDCDEQLFLLIHSLIYDENGRLITTARHIKNAETSGILPEGTNFYSEPLAFPNGLSFKVRKSRRDEWYLGALASTAGADLIFVDPDNGIECKIKRTARTGPKYVFWDEINAFVERDQSVIVYHHLGRTGGSHPEQVQEKLTQMKERFGKGFDSSAVIFRRGASRAFFIIASPRHKEMLSQRLAKMSAGPWKRHFDFL